MLLGYYTGSGSACALYYGPHDIVDCLTKWTNYFIVDYIVTWYTFLNYFIPLVLIPGIYKDTRWAIKIVRLRSGLKVYCFGVVESKNLSMQSWKFKKNQIFCSFPPRSWPLPEFFYFFKNFQLCNKRFLSVVSEGTVKAAYFYCPPCTLTY